MAKTSSTNTTMTTRDALMPLTVGRGDMPAHMAQDQGMGTELVGKFIIPPRLKVLQPQRDEQYAAYAEGSAILVPQKIVLAEKDQPFHFVPLLFYPEWLVVNPLELKGQLPMIRDRTRDPRSAIAKCARDPNERRQTCPENTKFDISYVETLNFLCLIWNRPEIAGMPVAISFARAEHKNGAQLSSLIKIRGAAIFGCVFEGVVPSKKRTNPKGAWYGLDVSNPSKESGVPAWVDDGDTYALLKTKHVELAEALRQDLIQLDQEDSVAPGDDTATSPQSGTF